MRYKVQHNYTSFRDGQLFGPWEAGTEIELDEPDGEWVERDSPGALEPLGEKSARPVKPPAKRPAKPGASAKAGEVEDDDL